MTYYEERLEQDLAEIRRKIARVGERVRLAVSNSVRALISNDQEMASDIVLGDLSINRAIRVIDADCHAFIARFYPAAGHLRFISSVLRLNVELERVGDYAVAISHEAIRLSAPPPQRVVVNIELMAEQALQVLDQSLQSFHESNAELARGIKPVAAQVERTFEKVFSDLTREGEKGSRPLEDFFALLVIFTRLVRVADQAKNICEATLFAAAGETKEAKIYRVLFVDERNAYLSQMAEAIARQRFPESGEYASAGWNPAESLEPRFVELMAGKGHDLGSAQPAHLDMPASDLAGFHVIVALEEDVKSRVPDMSLHTIPANWELDEIAQELSSGDPEAQFEDAYERVAAAVVDLMVALKGNGAN